MGESVTQTRRACVVLHAPGTPPPRRLLDALAARAMPAQSTPSAHQTLAALCRARHEQRHPVVLFDRTDAPPRLRQAINRYAPGTLLWTYDPGANPPVQAFVEPEPAPKREPEPQTEPEPRPQRHAPPATGDAAPRLRLTDDPRRDATAGDILDPEELDALLGPRDG